MGRPRSGVTFEEWALLAEVRAEMGRRGWSGMRMARESGIPVSNVRRYFTKAERSPSPSDLFDAARALGVSLSTLVERAEAVTDARRPQDLAQWRLDQGGAELGADDYEGLAEDAISQLSPEAQAEIRRVSEAMRPKRPERQARHEGNGDA